MTGRNTASAEVLLPGSDAAGSHCREKRKISRGERGFTLLELMAVLALVGLLMGLVLPGLTRAYTRERERVKLRQFLSVLRTVRSEAVTRHQRLRLLLDVKSGRYQVEGVGGQGDLGDLGLADPHLVWENPERSRGYIIFYGDGSSSGGKLRLTEPAGKRYLMQVETITGKVTLKTEGN